jgi:hypothetical protein
LLRLSYICDILVAKITLEGIMMAILSKFNHCYMIILAALIVVPLISVSGANAQIQMCPLAIVKSASPSDDTEFEFELGGNAIGSFTLQDPSDNIEIVEVPSETAGIFVNEILPPGWSLDDIQCTGDPGFEFSTFGINQLVASCEVLGEVPDGQCTFLNSKGTPVPTISQWGLISLAAVIGIAGLLVFRRKRAIS